MSRQIALVDAAKKDRSLVPVGHGLESKLKAEPVLLLWRRLIDTAVDEARQCRLGEPGDTALKARWWIEQVDPPEMKGPRLTFDFACQALSADAAVDRAKILRKLDAAWRESAVEYMLNRVRLRTRAVMSVAKAERSMGMNLALLIVSVADYEETVGIVRPDPPARVTKAAGGTLSAAARKASRPARSQPSPA